ncbi:terminase small subunit [Mesorhizobium kowhaii]|nr:terminase small subunit [Mesorhizobium kowhaii]
MMVIHSGNQVRIDASAYSARRSGSMSGCRQDEKRALAAWGLLGEALKSSFEAFDGSSDARKRSSKPALDNPRHERFCQLRAYGWPAYKAYQQAGFKCSKQTAFANSSRLLRSAKISSRIRELVEEFADAVIVTREWLAAELDCAIAVAHQRGQPAAAISAIMAKAKLFGLIGSKRADTNNDLNPYSQTSSDELIYQINSMANEIAPHKGKESPQPQGVWRR